MMMMIRTDPITVPIMTPMELTSLLLLELLLDAATVAVAVVEFEIGGCCSGGGIGIRSRNASCWN